MKTIYEISRQGKRAATFRPSEAEDYRLAEKFLRGSLNLPAVAEVDLVRHYTALSLRTFGVDNGFYPLGSCTMKYNPKLNEELASLEGFSDAHPLTRADKIQGSLELMDTLSAFLAEITGMDAFSLQPCAGAQGEYCGLLLIKQYHKMRNDFKRNKVIVPDSAHGTNPASAVMAGFEVIKIKSDENYGVDLDGLRAAVGDDTAALMLTNPTTLGMFEKNIKEISDIVHDAGGLLYYDGANLNAIMGIARPGDMGFDVVHLNLHKTFSTPHGGGGPGAGPVGCKSALADYLPNPRIVKTDRGYRYRYSPQSIGKVTSFYGNFGVLIRAFAYILTLGCDGLKSASETAVLNANYLKELLKDFFPARTEGYCMHEFVCSLQQLKDETGVSATDIAKGMIDGGIHPPTMYFPLIVHEALMFEPTETESKQTLEQTAKLLKELYEAAHDAPQTVLDAPHKAAVARPDEVRAARNPILKGTV